MARGKYAHIIDKLPRDFGTEPAYQEKVNAVKEQMLEAPGEGECPITPEEIRSRVLQIVKLLQELNSQMTRMAAGQPRNGSRPSAAQFAEQYVELRHIKDALADQESATNLLIESTCQLLGESYEIEGVDSLRLETGASVSLQKEPQAKVRDKEAHRLWCLENGYENEMVLPWQTTNALTKERLLQGLPEPPGVEAVSRDKFVLRNAK
jgi:hypothetical protein